MNTRFSSIPSATSKKILKKHPRVQFTKFEDQVLRHFVMKYGTNRWEMAAEYLGTKNKRQCKDRWRKFLDPAIENDDFTDEEDQLLMKLYNEMGNKWVAMSKMFKGRTDIQLKNRFKVLQRREFSYLRKERKEEIKRRNKQEQDIIIKQKIDETPSEGAGELILNSFVFDEIEDPFLDVEEPFF